MTQTDSPTTPATTGTSDQLDRIEGKLDWLIEALSGDEEESANVITTMDGERLELPSGNGFL